MARNNIDLFVVNVEEIRILFGSRVADNTYTENIIIIAEVEYKSEPKKGFTALLISRFCRPYVPGHKYFIWCFIERSEVSKFGKAISILFMDSMCGGKPYLVCYM